MLTFLSDLLSVITDKEQAPSSSTSDSSSEKYVNSVITCTISYLEEKVKFDLNSSYFLYSKYLSLLKKLSSVCIEMESLRRISVLQNYACSIALLCKKVSLFTADGLTLTRELVEKLTNPSTTSETIRFFTEYAAKDIHPCVIGEIVLKWWRVRRTEYPDTTFIKTLFGKIDNIYDTWLFSANGDIRYKELFQNFKLNTGFIKYSHQFYCDRGTYNVNNLIALMKCIEKGDGTELTLPINRISIMMDMTLSVKMMPEFTYNTAVFPPYGASTGHWYLEFSNENTTESASMVSLITESQQDILRYFLCYEKIYLHCVPTSDGNSE